MQRCLEIAEKLQAIVQDVLRSSDGAGYEADLDLDTDLRSSLGFDSLSIMYVLSRAEEEFGITLDGEDVIASTTSVRALASCIEKREAR